MRPRWLAPARAMVVIASVSMLTSNVIASDLIVSANDGKFLRVQGQATYPPDAPSDTLTILDASARPVKIVGEVAGLQHSLAGPPQAVAITSDGTLAVVAAPSRYDYPTRTETFGTHLQFVDLGTAGPRLAQQLQIAAHPNGLSINRQGTLLLAACLDGAVRVIDLASRSVSKSIQVSTGRLAGVSFIADGSAALVARRDEGGVAVLRIEGTEVSLTPDVVSTGIAPYTIDVASVGDLAVVSNAGLAGLAGQKAPGDADIISIIDVSKRPFKAIQHLPVPATPESVAISPNGAWIVAQSLNGSNLLPSDPSAGRKPAGRLTLFAVRNKRVEWLDEIASGEAPQGVVFAGDNKTVLAQFNVERAIAVFEVRERKLFDTGQRLALSAGPASIRTRPR
jgi:DNA-binding beta-propeller fold protein YncE